MSFYCNSALQSSSTRPKHGLTAKSKVRLARYSRRLYIFNLIDLAVQQFLLIMNITWFTVAAYTRLNISFNLNATRQTLSYVD